MAGVEVATGELMEQYNGVMLTAIDHPDTREAWEDVEGGAVENPGPGEED